MSAIPNNADPSAAPPARTRLRAVPPWAAATANQMRARGNIRCPSRSMAPIGVVVRSATRSGTRHGMTIGMARPTPRWRMPVDPTIVRQHGGRPPLVRRLPDPSEPGGSTRPDLEPSLPESLADHQPRQSEHALYPCSKRIRWRRIDPEPASPSADEPDELRQNDERQRDRPTAEATSGEADDHHDAGIQTADHPSERQTTHHRNVRRRSRSGASRLAAPRAEWLRRGRHSGDRPTHASP